MTDQVKHLTPIAVFGYRRKDHLERIISALKLNKESSNSQLFLFLDGAKSDDDREAVEATRKFAKTITGFSSIEITEQSSNLGLSKSIRRGVTDVLKKRESVIVLEDDILVSGRFLEFMNSGLEVMNENDEIGCLSGYFYPVESIRRKNRVFLIRGADCWGWGTTRRKWSVMSSPTTNLVAELQEKALLEEFDPGGAFGYLDMLKAQEAGKIDSWAIHWHTLSFLEGWKTLYPSRSLVQNIGYDATATHSQNVRLTKVKPSNDIPELLSEYLIEDVEIRSALIDHFKKYGKRKVSLKSKVINKLKFEYRKVFPRKRSSRPSHAEYSGDYPNWESAEKDGTTYDSDKIYEKTKEALEKIRDGEAQFERDSVILKDPEYPFPLIATLNRIFNETGKLSLLDFGGSLGSSYYQCRDFLRHIEGLKWDVVEQSFYVDEGSKSFEDGTLSFSYGIESSFKKISPNAVLFSSVLQYLPDPYAILEEVIALKPKFILLDRTCFWIGERDRITLQKVSSEIYEASYPCRFFVEGNFVSAFESAGYDKVYSFKGFERANIPSGVAYFRGFLFELKS